MLNGEVCFFENFNKTSQKLSGKVGGFSVSPGKLLSDYASMDRFTSFKILKEHLTSPCIFEVTKAARPCAAFSNIRTWREVQSRRRASARPIRWR